MTTTDGKIIVSQEINGNIKRFRRNNLEDVGVGNANSLASVAGESIISDIARLRSHGGLGRVYSVKHEVVSDANPAPIDYLNGVVYGYYSNVLYKSTDEGVTWTVVYTFDGAGGELKRLMSCSDGEVIALFNKKLLKSVAWPTPSSWTEKAAVTNGQFIEWSLDGDGVKFIVADYGIPHTNSLYMWISLDYGNTFTQYLKNTLFPGNDAGTHFHGVAYDSIDDRFWLCMGDNDYKGHYYSDDDGATWTAVTLGSTVSGGSAQATTIVATPLGMILGSDSGSNNGLFRILRTDDPADMRLDVIWRWPHYQVSVRGFPFRNFYDSTTGITFTCWRTDVIESQPMITWTNGFSGGILYAWEGTYAAFDGIRNIIVLPNGKLKAWVSIAGGDSEVLTIDDLPESVPNFSMEDTGNLRGGIIVDNSAIGVAVGGRSKAIQQTVAVGAGADASESGGVSIGWGAKSGVNTTTAGTNAQGIGRDSVVIGNSVTVSDAANENVVIGAGSSSVYEDSILVGRSITNTGVQNVIISGKPVLTNAGYRQVVVGWLAESAGYQNVVMGRTAKCTGNTGTAIGNASQAGTSGVAVGASATATLGSNDVAIGNGTTTTIANSVAIGARDLHIQDATKGLVLTSPNGTKYRVKVDDAGVLSIAAV